MARPRKHFTPQEKKAASRIKSKLYYDRNWAEISAARLKKRNKNRMSISMLQLRNHARGDVVLSGYLHDAQTLYTAFRTFIHPGRLTYIDRACTTYIKTQDQDQLQHDTRHLTDILSAMRRHENDVLEVAGLGSDWKAVQDKVAHIQLVVMWLEDLACWAMDGYDTLCSMYNDRLLKYQMYVD
ncbi:hypothetical protein BD779DRAFT_1675441 [Infundibulicybe gibba]|nr:hypothetical protein BD779DRAFT_1675441 [Infundibulicybe gibba]